jgi:hypothetical protein
MKKNIYAFLVSLIITATHALASGGAEGEGLSLIATFFIGFGVLIILFQFIPGLLLFGCMLKGLFSRSDKKAVEVVADNTNKS